MAEKKIDITKRKLMLSTIFVSFVSLFGAKNAFAKRRCAVIDPKKCHLCKTCKPSMVCSHGAFMISGKNVKINPEKCSGCSKCAEACHHNAITMV